MSNRRVRLWAIVGESGTGKSPTIKSLVSQPKSGRPTQLSQVQLRGGGYLDVHCKVMALQEAGWLPEKAVTEVDGWIIKQANLPPRISPAFINVLLALRFDAFKNTGIKGASLCPPAESYLSHFVDKGWDIQRDCSDVPGK